ncbi:imidazole glycerol phosphate synthase subunit HisF [bacterium SCSIO 12741]|nr:imidazole glycerol phosphate synthase subunit HisF [bacterium SCSIO 12741]
MLKKRIIPCLDIRNGRTVKGTNFVGIQDAGDPVEMARRYVQNGADELVLLDITATVEKRKTRVEWVQRVAREISVPFTVGGGINTLEDARILIQAGADKISLNSAAVQHPKLIQEMAREFGQQCVVVAIDTQYVRDKWKVFVHGGRTETALETVSWAQQAEKLGAGELLLTSINNDGTKTGFALNITHQVSQSVSIPVIASGGAGSLEHFKTVFEQTRATGGLAAGIFHYGEIAIAELKNYLSEEKIAIRQNYKR